MSDGFQQRPAAEIVADLNFERFVIALEQATSPIVPRRVITECFCASDGTVGDVLEELFTSHPQTMSIDVILEDAHWVGALEQVRWIAELQSELAIVKAELRGVRSGLNRWESFMDGRARPLVAATERVSRAASWSADRSHGTRVRSAVERRFEHP